MKVIHLVLGRANPNRMNWVIRVVHNLATAQKMGGFDVSVWGITDSFDKEDDLVRNYKVSWFAPNGHFDVSSDLLCRYLSQVSTYHIAVQMEQDLCK